MGNTQGSPAAEAQEQPENPLAAQQDNEDADDERSEEVREGFVDESQFQRQVEGEEDTDDDASSVALNLPVGASAANTSSPHPQQTTTVPTLSPVPRIQTMPPQQQHNRASNVNAVYGSLNTGRPRQNAIPDQISRVSNASDRPAALVPDHLEVAIPSTSSSVASNTYQGSVLSPIEDDDEEEEDDDFIDAEDDYCDIEEADHIQGTHVMSQRNLRATNTLSPREILARNRRFRMLGLSSRSDDRTCARRRRIPRSRSPSIEYHDGQAQGLAHSANALGHRGGQPDDTGQPALHMVSRFVRVTGLSRRTTEDTLRDYFQNRERSRGGQIEDIQLESEKGMAFITYVAHEDAERVAQKSHHKLDNSSLKVELCASPLMVTDTVVVRRLSPRTTKDCIFYYFDNERNSTAGVTSVRLDSHRGMALVSFADPHDAVNVSSTQSHVLDGYNLTVSIFVEARQTKDSVVLSQLPKRQFSEEHLQHFVENATKHPVKNNIFNDNMSVAIVQFEQSVDVHKIQTAIGKKRFKGCRLTVNRLNESHSVKVDGVPNEPQPSQESLTDYFENYLRSDGGDVLHVDLHEEAGCAIVTFCDPKVARRVCDRQHSIQGCPVQVSLYHDCLSQEESETTVTECNTSSQNVPEPVPIDDRDRMKVSYLMALPKMYNRLVSALEERGVYFDLESHPEKICLACFENSGIMEAESSFSFVPNPLKLRLQRVGYETKTALKWPDDAVSTLRNKLESTKIIFEPASYEETSEVKTRLAGFPDTAGVEVGFDEWKDSAVIAWDEAKYESVVNELVKILKQAKSAREENVSEDYEYWMSG